MRSHLGRDAVLAFTHSYREKVARAKHVCLFQSCTALAAHHPPATDEWKEFSLLFCHFQVMRPKLQAEIHVISPSVHSSALCTVTFHSVSITSLIRIIQVFYLLYLIRFSIYLQVFNYSFLANLF